jgi:hypothetical protein
MSALSSRSEGVALRPFTGLSALEAFLHEQVVLEVTSNVGTDTVPERGSLGLSTHDIEKLGLRIRIQNPAGLRAVVDPVVMDIADVALVLVALDRRGSVLRENHVLAALPLKDVNDSIIISEPGDEAPTRILSNRQSGFRIELALVQMKDIEGDNSIRPRRKGALIALANWEVKPVSDGDMFQPEELTEEVRGNLNLSPNTWTYFDSKPEILSATLFSDAASYYIDKDILDQIQILTGSQRTLAEMLVYSSAITQMIYEFSMALRETAENINQEELSESQIFRILRLKFKTKTDGEIVDLVREEPARAVAEFLANPKDLKKLMTALKEMNGGVSELSDFEDQ